VTPDGRALLVVQSNTGYRFRVDPHTGVATRVDLGGTLLTNGDGLLVQGRNQSLCRTESAPYRPVPHVRGHRRRRGQGAGLRIAG
jgi:hypothetical protein